MTTILDPSQTAASISPDPETSFWEEAERQRLSGPRSLLGPLGPLSQRARPAVRARFLDLPAWIIVTELFIGLGWLRAAVSKIIDPGWWSGAYIDGFVRSHADQTLGWYRPFVDGVVQPGAAGVAAIVVALQILCATTLLSGRARGVGLVAGVAMNLHFVAAGAVNPSAFYLLAQGAILLWLAERDLSRRLSKVLGATVLAGITVATFNIAFIRTLDPAGVIDDPAIMFVTVGGLAALGAGLAIEARHARRNRRRTTAG